LDTISNDKAGTINEAENSSFEAISCVLLSCFVVRERGRKSGDAAKTMSRGSIFDQLLWVLSLRHAATALCILWT
jgi:hypothetical protein